MSVRFKLRHTGSGREAARRRPTAPALAAAAVVVGLALSAAAAFAQAETAPSFPPPSDFLEAPVAAKSAPLPPPRPAQTEPDGNDTRTKRTGRLASEARPARRTASLAYAPVAAGGSWNRGDGACQRPAIIIDDYWRGGPIIDCRGGFRPR